MADAVRGGREGRAGQGGDDRHQLGIVLVNYRSEHLIVPRARELVAAGFSVAVSDNSGSLPAVDGVASVVTGANLGFAAGCNRAVDLLPAEVAAVGFHNPDVRAAPSDLDALHRRLRAQTRPGAVAPAERTRGRIRERGYHYPAALRELALGARALARRPQADGGGGGRAKRGRGRRFPGGGLLVVDRAAHEGIGGFSEDYFLYAEDLDYWHRLRASGRDCAFVSEVVVDHDAGTGSPLPGPPREVLRWLGIELFAFHHGGGWRQYRATHRMLLPLAGRRVPALAAAVADLWSQRLDPAAVAGRLRPALASGELWDLA